MSKKNEQLTQRMENILLAVERLRQFNEVAECEDSMRTFVRKAWHVIEPGVAYVHGWHIDAICEHLEAALNGEIRNLIINMPPRHMKSSLVGVMFPAWVWIKEPHRQFLYTSYAEHLSLRDSRKTRNLIKSNWYQQNWGDRYKIVSDQNEKRRFENDKSGYRLATSVGGTNTGDGGGILIADDPNNMNEVHSEAIREGVNEWWDQVMSTRLNDHKTGIRIVIQQRGHERDLTGHLMEKGGWDQLVLPAEYEGEHKATSIGWKDPRAVQGELLWPEKFGPLEITELKRDLGPIPSAGQLQQRPTAGEGALFKRESWNYYNPVGTDSGPVRVKVPGRLPIEKAPVPIPLAFEQVVQSWDFTFKDEADSDFVAGHAWGRIGSNVYLLARVNKRMDFMASIRAIRQMSVDFPCPTKLVEDKANGPAVINFLKNEIPGLIAVQPDGGKISRANAISSYVEAGNVYLPNPDLFPWVADVIEQAANFPRGAHDDDVDAMSQAIRRLFDSASNSGLPEFRVIPRLGEPETACHVVKDSDMSLPAHWRRWITVSPGTPGAALWFCETPQGSIRVYREVDISGVDASETGRRIAEASLPDIRSYFETVHSSAKWSFDIFLEKEAFAPVDPIGSYAELLEQGILGFEPTNGTFEERTNTKAMLRSGRFSAQLGVIEDSSLDRLRDLLRFAPPDFEELEWDRDKAIKLMNSNLQAYKSYMAMVEGRIEGEWPKIKFSSLCMETIASISSVRRDKEIETPYIRALLLGTSAPPGIKQYSNVMTFKPKPSPMRHIERKFRVGRTA